MRMDHCHNVMAGLVPTIHALLHSSKKGVDARHEAGHDVQGLECT
jgi:hypothetical protein